MQGYQRADIRTINVNNVSKNKIVGIIKINFDKTIKNRNHRSIPIQRYAQPNHEKMYITTILQILETCMLT
jgi:hypothetical protein